MELVFFFIIVLLFTLSALRWGSDSRDDLCSEEWIRRSQFRGTL